MNQDQNFSALRNLLALNRLEMPKDTQLDQFLVEFHHRQRAQLLVRESLLTRGMAWLQERIAGFAWTPTLPYGAAFAAIAITAVIGLSQQVQITKADGQPYQLSLSMPARDTAFAMIPSSYTPPAAPAQKAIEGVNFTPTRSDSSTTRFVLANNSRVAYDATVAF